MNYILFHYRPVDPTTWVYLSSLLTIGLYFKFSRLWSVRNLDLVGLILLAPGLLLVNEGVREQARTVEQAGYIWLFVMSGIFMIRLLLDPMMVRRPLLEPNLSAGGMTFIGTALLIFLMANVVNSKPQLDETAATAAAAARPQPAAPADDALNRPPATEKVVAGPPANPLLRLPPIIMNRILAREAGKEVVYMATVNTMAILSHLAVVIGMIVIGYRHFDNIKTGIAAAMLYLMLPYTAQNTGRVDHVLTGALLIWAIESYRRPLVSGMLMGLAIGLIYYPVFLLPLWLGFYWHRGLLRFSLGVATTVALLIVALWLNSNDIAAFWGHVKQMVGGMAPNGVEGFWDFDFIDKIYRIPVVVAFFALCASLALWPAQKNLGTLMSCSAAVMLGTQFWHTHGGGLYMAWYLPLMLLTIFRPNLEDRVALTVLGAGWFPKRRSNLTGAEMAA